MYDERFCFSEIERRANKKMSEFTVLSTMAVAQKYVNPCVYICTYIYEYKILLLLPSYEFGKGIEGISSDFCDGKYVEKISVYRR